MLEAAITRQKSGASVQWNATLGINVKRESKEWKREPIDGRIDTCGNWIY